MATHHSSSGAIPHAATEAVAVTCAVLTVRSATRTPEIDTSGLLMCFQLANAGHLVSNYQNY